VGLQHTPNGLFFLSFGARDDPLAVGEPMREGGAGQELSSIGVLPFAKNFQVAILEDFQTNGAALDTGGLVEQQQKAVFFAKKAEGKKLHARAGFAQAASECLSPRPVAVREKFGYQEIAVLVDSVDELLGFEGQ